MGLSYKTVTVSFRSFFVLCRTLGTAPSAGYPITRMQTGTTLSGRLNSSIIASGMKCMIHVEPIPSSHAANIKCVATIVSHISVI